MLALAQGLRKESLPPYCSNNNAERWTRLLGKAVLAMVREWGPRDKTEDVELEEVTQKLRV